MTMSLKPSVARVSHFSTRQTLRGFGQKSHPLPRAGSDPVLGMQAFAGVYQLVSEVASGGMATVYLAIRHGGQGFEKCCAIKRIHPHLARDKNFSDMFIDEARITARLSHPCVCGVFDFGSDEEGSYYIAMEFLRGETLSHVIGALAKRPEAMGDPRLPRIAARIIADLAEGLHAAHTAKSETGERYDIVHRDVTPQNLFVLYDGSVRVSDFGIARARSRLHVSGNSELKGKLSYMAPEQLDRKEIDQRVDIWSLGVVLWEFLTGRRLFRCESEAETVIAVGNRVVPPPSSLNPNVDAELDRIVLRALQRDPDQRYLTARDFSRDLERYLNRMGDFVPNMDLADWLNDLFPQGAARFDVLVEVAKQLARASAAANAPESNQLPAPYVNSPQLLANPTLPFDKTQRSNYPNDIPRDPVVLDTPPTRLSLGVSSLDLPRSRPFGAKRVLGTLAVAGALALTVGLTWAATTGVVSLHIATGATATSASAAPPPAPEEVEPASTADLANEPAIAATVDAPALELEPDPVTLKPTPKATQAPRTAAKPQTKPAAASATPEPPADRNATGQVLVTTPGGTATVLLGGRELGRTPARLTLPAGPASLTLRTEQGAERVVSVTVQPGGTALVTAPIARSSSSAATAAAERTP